MAIQKCILEELDMRSGRVDTIEKGDRLLDLQEKYANLYLDAYELQPVFLPPFMRMKKTLTWGTALMGGMIMRAITPNIMEEIAMMDTMKKVRPTAAIEMMTTMRRLIQSVTIMTMTRTTILTITMMTITMMM